MSVTPSEGTLTSSAWCNLRASGYVSNGTVTVSTPSPVIVNAMDWSMTMPSALVEVVSMVPVFGVPASNSAVVGHSSAPLFTTNSLPPSPIGTDWNGTDSDPSAWKT